MSGFTHLHLHTQYSLLDGFCRLPDLISRCKELGMDAVAMTDHGNMFGALQFYKEAQKQGIKPIIGCEVYVTKGSHLENERERFHLILLAENDTGYHNLMKIVSEGYVNGFYYKPRVDKDVLRQYSEGIICLSACIQGEVPQALLNDSYEEAKRLALEYRDIFGKDNFFLEVQDHGIREERMVLLGLDRLSKDTGIGLVATNDVHYVRKEDAKAHDVLLCIQTQRTVQEEDRMRFPSDDFYLKSEEEMGEIFQNFAGAMENTQKIAARCAVDIEFHHPHLPHFDLPAGRENLEYLESLVFAGIEEKHDASRPVQDDYDPQAHLDEAKRRARYEIDVIASMGFVDYFLIVWDFVRFAKQNGIAVGPGRGSAAGSIVSYALDITGIDPLQYNLLFERFLNPERVSMPDIDIDFCYERREEVIEYVKEKYGSDKVAQIVTFGTMAAKNAIRDVGRALDMPLSRVDQIAKLVPSQLNMTLDKALAMSDDFKRVYEQAPENRQLIDMARKVEGMPRHTSTHAAGVLITADRVDNFVPLSRNGEQITTQYNMIELEELGLLKMDFLGLRNLTVIQDAARWVEENEGVRLDMAHIDVEAPDAIELFTKADTIGVFQFESNGMRAFLRELKPDRFDDLVAANALFRPGPMDEIPTYVARRHDPSLVAYLHPKLEPILENTYGVIVYQEQVMQIVQQLAGYTLGAADNLRRAMSKKKMQVMEANRQTFLHGKEDEAGHVLTPGCIRNGIPEAIANQIYDQMIEFAKYAFNKSHSCAYAFVAMQTAILKSRYPAPFFAALLSSIMGQSKTVALYIQEAKRVGIDILPPNVNESYRKFAVEDGKIRFSLLAVKGVGGHFVDAIVAAREKGGKFKDIDDFVARVLEIDPLCMNKKAMENLVKAGAFSDFGLHRSQVMAIYESVIDAQQRRTRSNVHGQRSLFELMDDDSPGLVRVPNLPEYPKAMLLANEKEVLGIYLTDHPFRPYENKVAPFVNFSLEELFTEGEQIHRFDGRKVRLGGIILQRSNKLTKHNQKMCFLMVEDTFAEIEVIVFPKSCERYGQILQVDAPVLIEGTLQISDAEEPKLILDRAKDIKEMPEPQTLYVQLHSADKNGYRNFKCALQRHKGNERVVLYFKDKKVSVEMAKELRVTIDGALLRELSELLGEENVKARREGGV